MKSVSFRVFAFLLTAVAAIAQPIRQVTDDSVDGIRVVERGPHHRTWQRIFEVQDANGFLQPKTNSYVELAAGMHVWTDQKWVEASDEIEILEDRAVARKSQHKISFAANLNDPNGTIELLQPDGQRLRSRVIGLAYTEIDTGKSAFIAESRDSQGFVLGTNQVLYLDAMDSGIKADVRYTTTRSSFEQDIIIREQLPSPIEYGLVPEKTKLEVWTQFLEAPVPEKRALQIKRQNGTDEPDEFLNFDAMAIGPGRAFNLDEAHSLEPSRSITVTKAWDLIDDKTFLIEALPYTEAKSRLDALPEAQVFRRRGADKRSNAYLTSNTRGYRRMPVSVTRTEGGSRPNRKWQVARLDKPLQQRGLVLDYQTLNAGVTNHVFKGDTTYYITGQVLLSGTPTLEGGSVIKFAVNAPPNYVELIAYGPIISKTSPYRPAVFTAKDDNTVGEVISGSTGTPSGYYPFRAFAFWSGSTPVVLENVRICYASHGFTSYAMTDCTLRNAQIVDCFDAIVGSDSTLRTRNVLIARSYTPLYVSNSTFSGENLTISEATNLYGTATGTTFYLTNSLVVAVSSGVNFSGANNATSSTTNGVFQGAGAGNYYLAANSPHRNAGTTSINAQLLTDLKVKTTHPPVLINNNITSSAILAPLVQRDTDAPDVGYHYDPLDWLLSEVTVSNATLMLTNGVAIGTYGGRGIYLGAGAKLISQGTATLPNRLGHINRVQEQPTFVAGTTNNCWLTFTSSGPPRPELRLAFTDLSFLSGSDDNRSLGLFLNHYLSEQISISDSYLRGVFTVFWFYPSGGGLTVTLQNNLVERCNFNHLQDGSSFYPYTLNCYNNTFIGGNHYFTYASGSTWTVKDNLFDCDQLYRAGSTFAASNNGYKSGLAPFSNDSLAKANLVPDYQSGPMTTHVGYLGKYYFPTSGGSTSLATLVDAGSRAPAAAGLYHHTTRTDQTKDSSNVDIGFHYVALNGDHPMDTDGDGIPDYVEDQNGNGSYDSGAGETDWQTSNSSVSGSSALQVFTLLK
jgi:hypothetical protein